MTTPDVDRAEARFRHAAIRWAGGARGQVLVDASAQALADGLDSPTLRMLAGAPHCSADEEAIDLAPDVFEELGLAVAPRFSEAATVDAARLIAEELIAGQRSPREGTAAIYGLFTVGGYTDELADFSGFDDWYDMVDQGIVSGSRADVDAAVLRSARALVSGEPRDPFSIGDPSVGDDQRPGSVWSRLRSVAARQVRRRR